MNFIKYLKKYVSVSDYSVHGVNMGAASSM